jgi:glutamyl-tRNA reductase
MEEQRGWQVIRLNRTVSEEHAGHWLPLPRLEDLEIEALVVATGALEPIFELSQLDGREEHARRLVLDIGVPRQVRPAPWGVPVRAVYRDVDSLDGRSVDPAIEALIPDVEKLIVSELRNLQRACLARQVVGLLEGVHARREEFLRDRVPQRMDDVQGLGEKARRQVETVMKQVLREYSNEVFNAIFCALEHKERRA